MKKIYVRIDGFTGEQLVDLELLLFKYVFYPNRLNKEENQWIIENLSKYKNDITLLNLIKYYINEHSADTEKIVSKVLSIIQSEK